MKAPKGADEPLILVDESNRALGAAPKQDIHLQGLLHRAFSIFMVDDRGRILLQQRNPRKYHSAGLWANSCCGHPRPGERTVTASRRRPPPAPRPRHPPPPSFSPPPPPPLYP